VHQRYTNPVSLLKQLIQHFSGERTPYTQTELQLKDKHFVTLGDCRNWKVGKPNKLLDRRSYFTGMLFVPETGGAVNEKANISVISAVQASHNTSENQVDSLESNENVDTTSSNHISNAGVQVNAISDITLDTSTTDTIPTSSLLLDNFNSGLAVQTHSNQEETKSSSSTPPPFPADAPPTTSTPEPPSTPPLGLAILLRGSRISPPGPCLGSVTSGLSILLAAAAAASAKHKVTITQCGLADNKCFEFYGQ
ncbi:unnamed protein product, partial [Meganyctiphanes norvegica]